MASTDQGDTTALRTPWTKQFATPVRAFLQTESGSAGVLAAAIVVAVVWANLGGYESLWTTPFGLRLGDETVTRELRTWVNSGLMTLFFLVVGLEARREVDLGDLRDRGRVLLPVAAGLFGLIVPVGLYLAVNAGGDAAEGWGVAMSTDTALALGLLVVVGRDVPDRVRTFLLTLFVVDDIAALLVIAVMYTDDVDLRYLALAAALFGVFLFVRSLRLGIPGPVYAVIGLAVWASMLGSGVDPIVTGLAFGLAAPAYTPAREDLEEASGLFRQFREEPTPDLARTAVVGLRRTLSPNDRLQRFYHPWTSYVIVPLFALANAGIAIDGPFLRDALTSPITLGIVLGYVVGKPLAVTSASWAISRMTQGRVQPAVGWAAVAGSGTIAGIGFTVSFLIAAHAFDGDRLAQAKFGVLLAAAVAAAGTWVVFRITALLDEDRRTVALQGRAEQLVDLAVEVDPERDHVRGPLDAPVTVVEYGDFQCPYCGRAEPAVRAIIGDTDVRFVWRHLPLTDVHPDAELAAQAAEAAGDQGRFWEMHDLLLAHQDHLRKPDLLGYAEQLGLDVPRFKKQLYAHTHLARVGQDIESADISGVSGTPTFFVNGRRQYGAFDAAALTSAIAAARARVRIRR